MTSQIITDIEIMKTIRFYLFKRFDEKGVTFLKVCETYEISYNKWYPRIFYSGTLNLEYVNYILQLLNYTYQLKVINNEIHKVFQSKMNEI